MRPLGQDACGHAHGGIRERRDHPLGEVRGGDGVVVDDEQDVAGRAPGAEVHRSPESDVLLEPDEHDVRELGGDRRRGPVDRAVVDDDDLAVHGLEHERPEALAQHVQAVPAGDDEGGSHPYGTRATARSRSNFQGCGARIHARAVSVSFAPNASPRGPNASRPPSSVPGCTLSTTSGT